MDLKNDLKNAVNIVKDSLSGTAHKSTAEAEHARRDLAGDTMTPSEKVGSTLNEAKNNVQADVDHAKVAARREI